MQVAIDVLLIILFVVFMKQSRAAKVGRALSAAEPLPQMLEPLLKEAEKVAGEFEDQLKEKQRLIRGLNERLDSRIISLNLLLSRAEEHLVSHEKESSGKDNSPRHVYDIQQEIIDLGKKGLGTEEIANRMGISKGEVTLVLELKRKFQEMEKSN
jgi:hypothetical protein